MHYEKETWRYLSQNAEFVYEKQSMTKPSDERLMLDSSSLHGRVALSKVGNAQLLLIHPSISVCVCVCVKVSKCYAQKTKLYECV